MGRTRSLVTSTILFQILSFGCAVHPAGTNANGDLASAELPPVTGEAPPPASDPRVPSPTSDPGTPALPKPGISLSADKSQYAFAETLVATFAGLPGGAEDGISIARAGSPLVIRERWYQTRGATAGMVSFVDPPEGEGYVLRAFDSEGNLLAESAQFSVADQAATVSTDKSAYLPADAISVTYAGASHNEEDYLSISRVGGAAAHHVRSALLGGAASGVAVLSLDGLRGRFVARVYRHGKFQPVAESAAFTVSAGATVSVAKSSYAWGEPVDVAFSGLRGQQGDWIGISPEGSEPSVYSDYAYTGSASGTASFEFLVSGRFVARAYYQDSYDLEAESTPFIVGAVPALPVTLTTDKSVYSGFDPVVVSYSGMQGNALDWLGTFRPDSSMTVFIDYAYTNGATQGTLSFSHLYFGEYDVRAGWDDGYAMKGRSSTFRVVAALQSDKAAYLAGEPIEISFAGMYGSATDWVSIAKAGSPRQQFEAKTSTSPLSHGKHTFAAGLTEPGTYVARAYFTDDGSIQAESGTFAIVPAP